MPTTTAGQRVEHAHLAFTLAVQHAVAANRTEAACWSPYSVASALGLAASGARGATQDELLALLLGSADGDLAEHGAMLTEASTLQPGRGEPPVIGVANTLWTAQDLPVRPEFTAELANWPNGAVREAPFRTNVEAARQLINADIARTTHDLIPELLAKGTVQASTIATVVNALYLKVAWVNSFPAHATTPLPFHGAGSTADVPTMRLDKRVGYAATGGWQVVVLPAEGDVDAVVLLPDGDLAAAEPTLDADTLATLLAAPNLTLLKLFLPKFRVRVRATMTRTLQDLGVRTMFSDHADFDGITSAPMAVDSVLHEAVLTIDEQGLEGAAATAMIARALAMHRDMTQPIEVHVDRPFLFLVRHRASGAIYFVARVVQP